MENTFCVRNVSNKPNNRNDLQKSVGGYMYMRFRSRKVVFSLYNQ